ncbi:hypothetical protein BJ546DRAFT_1064223 [Cryomyces antarcticus]
MSLSDLEAFETQLNRDDAIGSLFQNEDATGEDSQPFDAATIVGSDKTNRNLTSVANTATTEATLIDMANIVMPESMPEVKIEASSEEPVAPATPVKSKKRASNVTASGGDGDDSGIGPGPAKRSMTDKPATTPRLRKAPAKTPGRAIPRTMGECNEADRMLLSMRDAGKAWDEIKEAWEAATGEKVGRSTLPNRYTRLKANVMVFPVEDNIKLLAARKTVEETFEKEKWSMIANDIIRNGGGAYSVTILPKQHKKLMETAADAAGLDIAAAGDGE